MHTNVEFIVYKKWQKYQQFFLALFLLVNALFLLDEFIYWNSGVNQFLRHISLNLFFVFNFSSLLKGPLLYWYTRTFIFQKFKFTRIEFLHLIPFFIYPAYMFFIYYSKSEEFKLSIISNYDAFLSDPYFLALDLWSNFSVIVYAIISLQLLLKHKAFLLETYNNFTAKEYRWIQILIIGFLSLWLVTIISYLQAELVDLEVSLGVISIYLYFILINFLHVYGLNDSKAFDEVSPQYAFDLTKDIEESFPHAELLKNKMEQEKLYLRKNLTLERLATELSIPVKQLSKTINGHFNKNFFEFIS
ncbi:MAG: hypothetical protein OCD00_06475 [Colwellia sp.]